MSAILPRAATFSKGPEFWGKDFTPATVYGGDGALVFGDQWRWGVGLADWLDWVSSLGANLLGHAHPGFTAHLTQALRGGTAFSLPSYLEEQVAGKLVNLLGSHVPGWSADTLSVRYGLSGSDACAMAVRLARAVTGRQRIISIGYHGWTAEFVSATPPAHGVAWQDVVTVPFGDTVLLESALYGRPACVIAEQPPQTAFDGYWQRVQELAHASGALFILDEVVTGFRYGLGGAAERFGVTPDIACYGKALGNGVPISCMAFRREYADWFSRSDPVFVSSTHFGNALGLAAADYVLDHWTQADVDHLWCIGDALLTGLRDAGYTVAGYPPVSLIKHRSEYEHAYFVTAMRDRGILINRPNLPCLAHVLGDAEHTVQAAAEVREEMDACDVAAATRDRLPQVLFSNR